MRSLTFAAAAGLALWPSSAFPQNAAVAAFTQLLTEQDRLADGTSSETLSQINVRYRAVFFSVAADAWKDGKARAAALVFAMGGGDPAILKTVLAAGAATGAEETLIKGVAAYAAADMAKAKSLLTPLKWDGGGAQVQGRLALVRAALAGAEELTGSAKLLDTARLLLPGTLVEEAALRRTAALAAKNSDSARYCAAISRYFRRFPRAPNAHAFLLQVIADVAAWPGANTDTLDAVAAALPQDAAATLFLELAMHASIAGKFALASAAASAAWALFPDTGVERQRLLLYRGSSKIVTDDFLAGVRDLEAVEGSRLPPGDRDLLAAALDLSGRLRQPVEPATGAAAASPAQKAEAKSQAVQAAFGAIASADLLLTRRKQ